MASAGRPLTIAVDVISAGSGLKPGAGGMINYYEGLLGALAERGEVARILAFVSPANGSLGIPSHEKIEIQVCHRLREDRFTRVLYEQLVLPILVSRAKVDILLSTVNVKPVLRRRPTVVVLQSLQYFFWPSEAGRVRRAYIAAAVPRSVRGADAVIAVSEAERQDALRLFGSDPSRVFTVHHGLSTWAKTASDRLADTEPYRTPSGRPYLFALSRLYSFKNHRRLIEAFATNVRERDPRHDLVIAGGDADVTGPELLELARAEGVSERVHVLGQVPQAAVPGLFAGATAVAYVSLYETFGLPVLEAFALGLPLVTASVSGSAEVAGDAACLVDPEDVRSIADGLHAVLTDEELRTRLRAAGQARLADFSWEKCAGETLRVLQTALARRSPNSGPPAPAGA